MKDVMNTKHIALLIAISVSAIGCTDKFFQEYPSNTVTEGNFYQTEGDFEQGVMSCYVKLKTQSGCYINELGYRSDELVLKSMAVSTADRYDIDHFEEESANGLMSSWWDAWYNGVYRCNDVLDHLAATNLSFDLKDQYEGECLFIRAWYYSMLYRCFGVVPLVTTVVSPAESMTIRRCSVDEIYDLLKNDLTRCVELLPDSYSTEKGRATKMAALALLGKMQLTFAHYAEAEATLSSALGKSGYGLTATTAEAFNVNNKFNKEWIFGLCYNKTLDGTGHGYWHSSNTSVAADRINPTPEFKAIYDSGKDNRYTLINDYRKVNNTTYAILKYDDTYDGTYITQVGNDWPFLRYSDVVLMYAEALARQNKLSDACTYLNKTRMRAGLEEFTTSDKDAFFKELCDERGREFALEGQRWFDLVRLGFAESTFNIDSHELVFPIPNSQIEIINNEGILWQNPGF